MITNHLSIYRICTSCSYYFRSEEYPCNSKVPPIRVTIMLPRLHRIKMSHKKNIYLYTLKFINFVYREMLYNALYSKQSNKIKMPFLILAHKRINISRIKCYVKSDVIGRYVLTTCNVHFYFCQKSRLTSLIFRVQFPSDLFTH